MSEIICNTSPLQYLHQLNLLHLLRNLAETITVPPAVVNELNAGLASGLNLPDLRSLDWVLVRQPSSATALPLVTDLGPGEREVLALGLETFNSVCVLDDALARQVALALQLRITGTLGILLAGKRARLISAVQPEVERLDNLGFRLSPQTRTAVLKLAGELTG